MSFSALSWSAIAVWAAIGVARTGLDVGGLLGATPLAVPAVTVCRCLCDASLPGTSECPATDCPEQDGGVELPNYSWLNDLVAAVRAAAAGAFVGSLAVAWLCCHRVCAGAVGHSGVAAPRPAGTSAEEDATPAAVPGGKRALAHLAVDASLL